MMEDLTAGKKSDRGLTMKPIIVSTSPSENWRRFLMSQNLGEQGEGLSQSKELQSSDVDEKKISPRKHSESSTKSRLISKKQKVGAAVKPIENRIKSAKATGKSQQISKQLDSLDLNASESKVIETRKDSKKQNSSLTSCQTNLGKVKIVNNKVNRGKGESRSAARGSKFSTDTPTKESSNETKERLTRVLAIDCEMVGVQDPKKSMLARVSIVNSNGDCVYDKFVLPTEPVHDYRTWVSGIRPRDLQTGEPFEVVRQEVLNIIKDRILVGHSVGNDFKALKIKHPRSLIRDTSKFGLFQAMAAGKTPSLKYLARYILGVNIQSGEHSSVQDAKATVQLYNLYQKEWEEEVKIKYLRKRR